MWSTWGASPWEGKSWAEVGIVNRKVARQARAGQTFPQSVQCTANEKRDGNEGGILAHMWYSTGVHRNMGKNARGSGHTPEVVVVVGLHEFNPNFLRLVSTTARLHGSYKRTTHQRHGPGVAWVVDNSVGP